MDTKRRKFIQQFTAGTAGALVGTKLSAHTFSAKSYSRIIGANNRINIGIQGLGRRLNSFIDPIADKTNNVSLLYLCDVMQKQRERAATLFAKKISNTPKLVNDFQEVLADKNVDAVIIATPDHWHTPGALMAMASGKHVYLEKPCSHNMFENELLVAGQKKYDKVVQMGTQQRSSIETAEIIKEIHNGILGDTYKATAFYVNSRGEVPVQKKAAPPDGLDWKLFQGPAPRRAYTDNTWDYNWHWYGWDYGTAEMGNNGTHELDIARWALDVNYPQHVTVNSGKFHFKDDGWEMYDTMDARFTFKNGKSIEWDCKARNGYSTYGGGRGCIIYGSEGSVFVNRGGYELFDRKGKSLRKKSSTDSEAGTALGGGGGMTFRHLKNFFDTLRQKDYLSAPIDQGAISQSMTHYANIASRIGKPLEIDDSSGRIFDRQAMQLWSRTYEPGWEPKI